MDDRSAPDPDAPATLDRLVRLARGGDAASARVLTHRACTLALRTASALMGSRERARDVSQGVAVDVMRGLAGLREPAAFDGWVHRITCRHARRALRRDAIRRRREIPITFAVALEQQTSAGADAPERIETRQVLAQAIAELPARQRIALALRYVHDLSDAEIASALRCREGTVHALLSRGRAALRRSSHLSELKPFLEGGTR